MYIMALFLVLYRLRELMSVVDCTVWLGSLIILSMTCLICGDVISETLIIILGGVIPSKSYIENFHDYYTRSFTERFIL